ncbi:MAG: DUF5916 domain-containing protein [Bacteroidota bacterium]
MNSQLASGLSPSAPALIVPHLVNWNCISAIFLLCTWLAIFWPISLLGQQAFPPPEKPQVFSATQVEKGIVELDGWLEEPQWYSAQMVSGFTQRDPIQGAPASFDTQVRVLYDQEFLYIGAICADSLADRNQVRVRNLQRDFQAYGNDRFGVAIDGLGDKRNAVGFEVTPYGSQRELQVIDGAEFNGNVNWDALWFVRTQITDTAWIVEMAIPWKTLRYKEESEELLISFTRNIRRNNEVTAWPAYPRAFSHFRMAYAALLQGLQLPPPAANFQLNPYLLANTGRIQEGQQAEERNQGLKVGGEFKWAITPNAVLDGTINTDFAQADVDQQVQNLTRFSVLFPERRQFFLENANIFRTSTATLIQPFFSRRIGLDDNGRPIPLDGGLRFTSQTSKQTSGVLTMRQRGTANNPGANFAVGRYVHNFSGQSRLGGMVTYRRDDPFEQNGQLTPAQTNTTATVNTFFRPRQSLSFEAMLSASNDAVVGSGLAAQTRLWQEKNWGFLSLGGQFASPNYVPGVGFLAFSDYLLAYPSADFDFRPGWLPSFVRSFGPDVGLDLFWRASDRSFQQGILNIAPIDFEFQTGGDFEIRVQHEWQQLDQSFRPLGIEIAPGFYSFSRVDVGISSDFSRKLAGEVRYEVGGYYDGQLNRLFAEVRLAPLPHVELTGEYRFNQFRGVGIAEQDVDAHLIAARARLALTPRIQLISSYQWNSANQTDIWNIRFAWEYRPLSFLYIVFNSNQVNAFLPEDRFSAEELIGKITFLRQF